MVQLGVRRAVREAFVRICELVQLPIGLLTFMAMVKFIMFFIVWNFGSMACALAAQCLNKGLNDFLTHVRTHQSRDCYECKAVLDAWSMLPTTHQVCAVAIGAFAFRFRLVPWAWVVRAPTCYRCLTEKMDMIRDALDGRLLRMSSSNVARTWFHIHHSRFPDQHECSICCDTKSEIEVPALQGCQHRICRDCRQRSVMEMNEASFSCPCSTKESPCVVYSVNLLEEIFKGKKSRLPGIMAAKAGREAAVGIVEGETLRHCSTPGCNGTWKIQLAAGQQPHRQRHSCKTCKRDTCTSCGYPWYALDLVMDRSVPIAEQVLALPLVSSWTGIYVDTCSSNPIMYRDCFGRHDHMSCEQYATFLREDLPELLNEYARVTRDALDALWNDSMARALWLQTLSWNLLNRLCQNGMRHLALPDVRNWNHRAHGHPGLAIAEFVGELPTLGPENFGPNVKDCPGCAVRTFKDGGCNHMTCSLCHHEYCWMCLRVWRTCDCVQL